MRFLVSLIVIWFLVGCVSAQTDDLRLIDEIGSPNCETLITRFDNFLAEVTNDPKATGYIVVHGGRDPIENLIIARAAETHVRSRRVPTDRIIVLSTNDKDDFRIKFWKSTNNAKPLLKSEKIDAVLPADLKQIRFADDIVELDGFAGKGTYSVHGCEVCCLRSVDFRILSELLQRNPEFDAEFVIRARSRITYKKVADLIRKDVVQYVTATTVRTRFIYGGNDKQLKNYDGKIATVSVSLVRR